MEKLLDPLTEFKPLDVLDAMIELGNLTGLDDRQLLEKMAELKDFKGKIVFIELPNNDGNVVKTVSVFGDDGKKAFYRTVFVKKDGSVSMGTSQEMVFEADDDPDGDGEIKEADSVFSLVDRYLGYNSSLIDALGRVSHFLRGTEFQDPNKILDKLPLLGTFQGTIDISPTAYLGNEGFSIDGMLDDGEQVHIGDVVYAEGNICIFSQDEISNCLTD